MTLSTHMIVGTAVAALFPNNPALGFVAAFGSHFALDAIPHWDYPIAIKRNAEDPMRNDIIFDMHFFGSFVKICLDGIIGLIIAGSALFLLDYSFAPAFFVGSVGAVLPDFLQLVYMKWRHEPLATLQRFHIWIQKDRGFKIKNNPAFGIISQIIVIAIIILLLAFFRN